MKKPSIYIIASTIMALQVLDVITTNLVLQKPHGLEANPLVKFSMSFFGDLWWLPKIAVAAVIVYLVVAYPPRRFLHNAAIGIVIFYAVTVVNNIVNAFG
jgi:hypothetical protein